MIYKSFSERDTRELAERVAGGVKRGDMVTLSGELGSGKTFFARALIEYFFPPQERTSLNVTSPTFNLVKGYSTPGFDIYHMDLYRIGKVEELYELDLETIFQNVSLVEWPSLIYGLRPRDSTLEIEIRVLEDHREFILGDSTAKLVSGRG
ncbi:MAG: tRNA (adenosine(37)-N6)-threonylcarbamoyltransferase complex ATPase subunit type 1 TsaE [Rickettsiales bacterium]|jgi:tRNA threonylcarbamoyladenosine biosynthesis protein TsaE|nr:tRNA (adenosine(37)-N6)-threonylcarbamoyltransferase complex ATPase subunit type 1 TsaE [Rickettsiales bacterium]